MQYSMNFEQVHESMVDGTDKGHLVFRLLCQWESSTFSPSLLITIYSGAKGSRLLPFNSSIHTADLSQHSLQHRGEICSSSDSSFYNAAAHRMSLASCSTQISMTYGGTPCPPNPLWSGLLTLPHCFPVSRLWGCPAIARVH